jgi:excisionase family DNA binding protein
MAENGRDAAEWLTLAEAASRLDVSIYTVRRQVKRGELQAEQVATPHGRAWRVRLTTLPGELPTVSSEVKQPAQGVDAADLLRLVEKLQQQNLELAGRVGYFQAENAQLRERLALMPPAAPEPVPAAEAVSEPATRRWWRRALRWVQV